MTTLTVEPVEMMTRAEAERATERIRSALDRVSVAWGQLGERIAEAYQRRADLALGYASWAEYAAAELRPAEGLAADVRRQLVGLLSAEGMSTRAIAPTVGVTQRQVSTDVRSNFSPDPQVVHAAPPAELTPSRTPPERIDPATGEVLDEEPRPITGLDGKTYTRRETTTAPTDSEEEPVTTKVTNWGRWDEARELAAQGMTITEVHERLGYPSSPGAFHGTARARGITFPDARIVARNRKRSADVLDRATGVIVTAVENLHDIVNPAHLDAAARDEALARLLAARHNLNLFIRTLKDS